MIQCSKSLAITDSVPSIIIHSVFLNLYWSSHHEYKDFGEMSKFKKRKEENLII